MKDKILIEFQQIDKSFPTKEGSVQILKKINLKIYQGEFVIIFGPSGCGKSTLLHILLGLEEPTAGKVLFQGKDLYSLLPDQRALLRRQEVGMIYQQPLWISALDVKGNVTFPLHLLGASSEEMEQKVLQVLQLVDMTARKDFYPTELSSGQQQKISLARSLITNPILVVADEPTGNLDTVSGHDLLNIFLKLHEKDKTIVMVTHDLEYLKYATKIFHMIDGKIVEEYLPKKNRNLNGKKTFQRLADINVHDAKLLEKLNF